MESDVGSPPADHPTPTTARDEGCFVGLTHEPLDVQQVMDEVRSPQAGAIVVFAGTTRDNFGGKQVRELRYTSYAPRAQRTMLDICRGVRARHGLQAVAMVHRLGTVPVGQESVLVAASSPHRAAAFRAAEEALELCKDRVEVWKLESYEGEGEGGAVWKANRDGAQGYRVPAADHRDGGEDVDVDGTEAAAT